MDVTTSQDMIEDKSSGYDNIVDGIDTTEPQPSALIAEPGVHLRAWVQCIVRDDLADNQRAGSMELSDLPDTDGYRDAWLACHNRLTS